MNNRHGYQKKMPPKWATKYSNEIVFVFAVIALSLLPTIVDYIGVM